MSRLQARPDLVSLRIAGSKLSADASELVSKVSLSRTTGAVAELAIVGVDPADVLSRSGLATTGVNVTYDGGAWQVGTIGAQYLGSGIEWTFRCRSKIARTMRRSYAVRADRKVSASDWVRARVLAAGGKAICQPTAKKSTISQSGGDTPQSELDVLKALASENGFDWVESDGTLIFGTKHWAWQGNAGTALWKVTWRKSEATNALTLAASRSDDDFTAVATAQVTLPQDVAQTMRPWDRIALEGAGGFNGTWLIESIELTRDGASPASLQLVIPRKPRPKAGSTPKKTERTDTTW